MVELPLIKKLKKNIHKEIAVAQDILIREIFNVFKTAVLHGGTTIWRCYYGNRFSEDIYIYLSGKEKSKIDILLANLENLGFKILKRKLTLNAFYSKLQYQKSIIRLEVLFKLIKNYITREYEMIDGLKIIVNTLSPEKLIEEKTNAYLKRRLIRDIYDIYFLLDFVENKNFVKKNLFKLLNNFKNPIDEQELKYLIISGVAPKLEEIIRKIQKYVQS